MNPTLKTSLHCAVDNTLRQVPLVLYSGTAGSMLVAGEERWSRYLPDRFFWQRYAGEPPSGELLDLATASRALALAGCR